MRKEIQRLKIKETEKEEAAAKFFEKASILKDDGKKIDKKMDTSKQSFKL